jgi:hypothetical protein
MISILSIVNLVLKLRQSFRGKETNTNNALILIKVAYSKLPINFSKLNNTRVECKFH